MDVKQAIENLYLVFAKYTPANMEHCDCGCIDENDVKKLASKKLRELEEDDFIGYHYKAMTTWGEVEHYKHFLPRILEVHHDESGNGLIGFFEITTKLEYAQWNTWEEAEIKAVKDFMLADWGVFVNERDSSIGIDDLEYYSFFFSPKVLINSWEITKAESSLRNFVDFFYSNGSELIDKGFEIQGNAFGKEFTFLIHNSELLEKLEQEFFKVNDTDKEYATTISTVLQMIEQERSISKT